VRHLRAEATSHVLAYRGGKVVRSGRGVAFWFRPMAAAIAEVPVDDRNLQFLLTARSRDFQDVTVQGVITYRVLNAEQLAERIDFSIDLASGLHRHQPLEQLASLLTGLAQQVALQHVAQAPVQTLLTEGFGVMQTKIETALLADAGLASLGIEVVDVRLSDVSPTPELEKALQTPTREALQQAADEAMFQRRALAVEKERAIAENELNNQIQLSKQREQLIAQEGQNARMEAAESAEAARVKAVARGERVRLEAAAEAERIAAVEQARVDAERNRVDVYRELPPVVMMGLAAEEIAKHLQIEHLNINPDLVRSVLDQIAAQPERAR